MTPLSLHAVQHSYKARRALDGIDLELAPGVTALVGVNGAGKSTLMRIASGAMVPTAGEVRVCEVDPYGRDRRSALPKVALMPQALTMPRSMTALEVVGYLTWMRGLSTKQAAAQAETALEQVGLSARARTKVGQLSGGMVRRLALAQALAVNAELVLLDEPSTGLDPQQRRVMVELISGLDGTVLMSSHVMEDIVDVADNVIVLHDGKVIFHGPLPELEEHAPPGTEPSRRAETAFLSLITTRATD